MKHVREQQQRSGVVKIVKVEQDTIDIEECYKRVENLRQKLRVSLLQTIIIE